MFYLVLFCFCFVVYTKVEHWPKVTFQVMCASNKGIIFHFYFKILIISITIKLHSCRDKYVGIYRPRNLEIPVRNNEFEDYFNKLILKTTANHDSLESSDRDDVSSDNKVKHSKSAKTNYPVPDPTIFIYNQPYPVPYVYYPPAVNFIINSDTAITNKQSTMKESKREDKIDAEMTKESDSITSATPSKPIEEATEIKTLKEDSATETLITIEVDSGEEEIDAEMITEFNPTTSATPTRKKERIEEATEKPENTSRTVTDVELSATINEEDDDKQLLKLLELDDDDQEHASRSTVGFDTNYWVTQKSITTNYSKSTVDFNDYYRAAKIWDRTTDEANLYNFKSTVHFDDFNRAAKKWVKTTENAILYNSESIVIFDNYYRAGKIRDKPKMPKKPANKKQIELTKMVNSSKSTVDFDTFYKALLRTGWYTRQETTPVNFKSL